MNLISRIFTSMNNDLPKFDNLDQGVDFLMKYLRGFSDGLDEYDKYVNKRWLEARTDIKFHESVLHIFEEDGNYLRIIDGDIYSGGWEHRHNGFIKQINKSNELFELVFLNDSFFIIKKYGDHSAKKNHQQKYFFLVTERQVKILRGKLRRDPEWPDILEEMYLIYKNNTNYTMIVVTFFFIIIVILLLSTI